MREHVGQNVRLGQGGWRLWGMVTGERTNFGMI